MFRKRVVPQLFQSVWSILLFRYFVILLLSVFNYFSLFLCCYFSSCFSFQVRCDSFLPRILCSLFHVSFFMFPFSFLFHDVTFPNPVSHAALFIYLLLSLLFPSLFFYIFAFYHCLGLTFLELFFVSSFFFRRHILFSFPFTFLNSFVLCLIFVCDFCFCCLFQRLLLPLLLLRKGTQSGECASIAKRNPGNFQEPVTSVVYSIAYFVPSGVHMPNVPQVLMHVYAAVEDNHWVRSHCN